VQARAGSVSQPASTALGEAARDIGLGLVDALTAKAGSVLFGGMTSFLDSSSSIPSPTGCLP
jgi:hypothetical protein